MMKPVKTLLLILLLGAGGIIHAQTVFREVPPYDFATFPLNRLEIPADSSAFLRLFAKFDTLFLKGKGNIHIVHFGGSHIQADVFSNRFRSNLLLFQPDVTASRGYIFPYSAARTNTPWSYVSGWSGQWTSARNTQPQPEITLGMGGIAVATTDTAAELRLHIRKPDPVNHRFIRLRMLTDSLRENARIQAWINDTTFVEAIADSSNTSYLFMLPAYADSVAFRFLQPDSGSIRYVVRGFLAENDFSGITYHSLGINGAAVPSWLRCQQLTNELSLIQPDLVIFSIGINDASTKDFDKESFIRNYRLLIGRIRQAAPDCAILFTTNNDSYRRVKRKYRVNENGPVAREAFFQLAKENGAAVWDMFTIMGGLKSMAAWEKAGLARHDKVHFTPLGYILIGDLLYNAFIESYINYVHYNALNEKYE